MANSHKARYERGFDEEDGIKITAAIYIHTHTHIYIYIYIYVCIVFGRHWVCIIIRVSM